MTDQNLEPANLAPNDPNGETRERAPEDAAGVEDAVAVNKPNPNLTITESGERVYDEGVSGPDPRFWGDNDLRPDPFLAEQAAPEEGVGGVPADTIAEDGRAGPDSRFWTKQIDENGIEQYVGRDPLNYLPERNVDVVVDDRRSEEVVREEQQRIEEIDAAARENTVHPDQPEQASDEEGGA